MVDCWWDDMDTDYILFTTRCIHGYLLTFWTWRLSLNYIPMYYLVVLHRSQWAYFSLEVPWCTLIFLFDITDISIPPVNLDICSSLPDASCWSDIEQDDTLESQGSVRISPIEWWFRGYFCYDTLNPALLLLQRLNYFAVSYWYVDIWSHHTLGQLFLGYKCQLLTRYF